MAGLDPAMHPLHKNSSKRWIAGSSPAMTKRAHLRLLRHHDLAEVSVGLHVLEGLCDVVERKHFVDRQFQLAGFHRGPDVLFDVLENRADLLDRAGTEGDADIMDAAGRVQVEIEI